MSSQSLLTPGVASAPREISLRSLLWIYLAIPLVALAIIADNVLLGDWLRQNLTTVPGNYVVLALVFGTPHIVASNLLLVTNRDYRNHYRREIIVISAALLVVSVVLGLTLPREALIAIISAWTVTHVVKQQIGIGNSTSRLSGPLFKLWTWSGIAVGTVFYNAIFQRRFLADWISELRIVIGVLAAFVVVLGIALYRQAPSPLGRWWLGVNTATMSLSGLFYLLDYPFFAILLPRLVHDVTAFVIYINHDGNRLAAGRGSWIYRPFSWSPRIALFTLPVAAIGLTAVMQHGADSVANSIFQAIAGFSVVEPISLGFVGYLSFMHYAFESFTWKGDSPYRKYLNLTLS